MNRILSDLHIKRSTTQTAWTMKSMVSNDNYELYYLISGHLHYLIGSSLYDVTPGDLVVVAPHQLHRSTALRDTVHDRYICKFSDDALRPFISSLGQEAYDRFWRSGCIRLPSQISQRVFSDLKQLDKEAGQPGQYSVALCLHLLEDVILSALLHGTPKTPVRGEIADKVQALAGYIAGNYAKPISLHEAAAMACMEETHFSKRFKSIMGVGFLEYLTQTRLQAACQLLMEIQLSISEVAEQCGFSSANYFGDVFRLRKGISPYQYRKTRCSGL